ncbi:hypothetical protein PN478_07205 [Dolichospermum circinale CS-534/05]|uniref:hypothetical protein n=1 Tax=Dolichospermum circinale TaxID=109265 RepID=UPI00232F0F95|nr:hypothetical protein [Dolichospermum circinale]MDB9453433.1 hypothetical protein [Dolichospermum circinale CS-541/06]MDB9463277.1 hypothetical protein [Dolichospermum circinale CS-541/04]MDB9490305.1 hypothetical protein [Dolichospermum circinale CS-534/05]MDB9548333.1 hypothetical protein [Dolichospermum circinale CS-1031]
MYKVYEYHLHFSGGNIMLSTEFQQESMKTRIEKIVAILMEERPLFKEELNAEEMIQHLCNLFQQNLPIDEFNSMEDQELKKHCSGIMVLEAVAGTLNELTPEQIAIFDEMIKRK